MVKQWFCLLVLALHALEECQTVKAADEWESIAV
jgi:hypothetical protein